MNLIEQVRADRAAGVKMHWTAEQTAHQQATADRWAIIHDPTPGGKKNADGSTTFSLRFPALLICDLVSEPEAVAKELADYLEAAERMAKAVPA